MNKLLLVLVAVAGLLILAGCLTTTKGSIDWDFTGANNEIQDAAE